MTLGPADSDILNYLALTAVGPTTLRKMAGVAGTRKALVTYFSTFDLKEMTHSDFDRRLDCWTKEIGALWWTENWGAARKAINLFIRDCCANYWLRRRFDLDQVEALAEIPLDSRSMTWLIGNSGDQTLPKTSVSNLTPSISKQYQNLALKLASAKRSRRVYLDMIAWPDV